MIKKTYYLLFLCLGIITFSFISCGSDDDDTAIDEEWKAYQDTEFNKVAADKSVYTEIKSEANNGSVYWKESSVITDSDLATRISPQGTPNFTDTVVVRYEGWYFDTTGKKYIFDSTENPSLNSIANSFIPNKQSVQFAVNGVIGGWITLLQDMTVGEEREVCIPQQLAYGSTGSGYIPGYTTLWFRLKLLKIKSMKGLKDS